MPLLEDEGAVRPDPGMGTCEPERYGVRANQRLYLKHVVVDHRLPPDPRAPLTAEEWHSSTRYRDRHDQHRYVQTRLALRTLLGHIQGVGPDQVGLVTGPQGKPELSENPDGLALSVSHSGDDSLIAVARGCPIGLDIERDSPRIDIELIAHHFFTPHERATMNAAQPSERRRSFLAIWTAKEAYAKGLGLGLTLDPLSFEVRSAVGGFQVCDPGRPESNWWVRSFQLCRGVLGAIAVPIHAARRSPEGCA